MGLVARMGIELGSADLRPGDVDFCGTLGVAKDTQAGFTGITLTVTIYPDPRQAPEASSALIKIVLSS